MPAGNGKAVTQAECDDHIAKLSASEDACPDCRGHGPLVRANVFALRCMKDFQQAIAELPDKVAARLQEQPPKTSLEYSGILGKFKMFGASGHDMATVVLILAVAFLLYRTMNGKPPPPREPPTTAMVTKQ